MKVAAPTHDMMKQAKGFTIIEVMIVIAVIGILAAVAIPNYMDWLPKSRVNGAARELFTELQLARMKAISENNDYRIDFDESNNSYSIYDNGVLVKTIDIDNKHDGIQFGDFSGSLKVTFTGDTMTFRPTGLLAGIGGSVYLIPSKDIGPSRTDRQRKIGVIKTGRVRLYQYGSGGWE